MSRDSFRRSWLGVGPDIIGQYTLNRVLSLRSVLGIKACAFQSVRIRLNASGDCHLQRIPFVSRSVFVVVVFLLQ